MSHARWLVAGVVVLAVVYAALQALPAGPTVDAVNRFEPLVVKLIGFAGCMAAAFAFERGDHLRNAWFVYGMSFFWIASLSLLSVLRLSTVGDEAYIVLVALSNLSGAAGAYLLARTWFVAGLELPASRWTRRTGMLIGLLIGAASGGYGFYLSLHAYLADGKIRHLGGVFSPLGDIAAFTFIVPIFLTALALRGGRVAEVWMLLALANLSWLLFDAQSLLPTDAPHVFDVAVEETRILACTLAGVAGLLQRRITVGVGA